MRNPDETISKQINVRCPHCSENFDTQVDVEVKINQEIEIEVT